MYSFTDQLVRVAGQLLCGDNSGAQQLETSGRKPPVTTRSVQYSIDKMRRFSSLPCSLSTIAKRYNSDMAQNYVKRVTLFKVPKSEHIDEASKQRKYQGLVCTI